MIGTIIDPKIYIIKENNNNNTPQKKQNKQTKNTCANQNNYLNNKLKVLLQEPSHSREECKN